MKSAYELALERMAAEGIDRPRDGGLDDDLKQRMAETRRKAEARLAELEILEREKLAAMRDPAARRQAEEQYVAERRRIEQARDRELEKLRGGSSVSGDESSTP
ncbi:MAG TPA: hypothetical protein VMT85_20520 [Thermoanaerobaculia bacterium]|nr:hypothetical protein [Thermoanaerobaculia bacterium]